MTGKVEFFDKKNDIYGQYTIGGVKRKHQDYLTGSITRNGEYAGEVYGNYMGYMDISNKRYWDLRENHNYYRPLTAVGPDCLPSDSTKRADSNILRTGDFDKAQIEKESIE